MQVNQLELFALSQADLESLTDLGFISPVGRTPDGCVTSYALTGVGRILLSNSLQADDSTLTNGVPIE